MSVGLVRLVLMTGHIASLSTVAPGHIGDQYSLFNFRKRRLDPV